MPDEQDDPMDGLDPIEPATASKDEGDPLDAGLIGIPVEPGDVAPEDRKAR